MTKWKLFLSQALALAVVGCGGSSGTHVLGSQIGYPIDPETPSTPPSGGQYQTKTFSYSDLEAGSQLGIVSTFMPVNAASSQKSDIVSTVLGSIHAQLIQALPPDAQSVGSLSQNFPACATSQARELAELLNAQGSDDHMIVGQNQAGGSYEDLPEGAERNFYMITASQTVRARKMLAPNETTHCTIFAELDGQGNPCIDRAKALTVAQAFDSSNPNRPGSGIYDQVRTAFGSEWNQNPPGGRDGDMKIVIMFFRSQSVGDYLFGYTSPVDGSQGNSSYSNKGEILYLNGDKDVGQNLSTLAHEFQHLINENEKVSRQGTFPSGATSENETINEGLSQIAEDVCGFDLEHGNRLLVLNINDYFNRPEDYSFFRFNQSGLLGYGQGYLFFRYVREQFGDDAIRSIVKSSSTGKANLDAQLAPVGFSETFRRWAVASYATNLSGNVPSIYRYPSGFKTNASYNAGQLTGPKLSPVSLSGTPSTKSLSPWSVSFQGLSGSANQDLELSVRLSKESTVSVIYEAVKGSFSRLDQ